MGKEILKMEHITKIYPNGVMANKDVSFSVREGEIHALCRKKYPDEDPVR